MISKNQIKYIKSLELKKNRLRNGVFVAEGHKGVHDIMQLIEPVSIIATREWWRNNGLQPREMTDLEVTDEELRKASFQKTPQQVLALFPIPNTAVRLEDYNNKLNLVLDGVQDPGNLGTIIRIADWFGISNIICSNDTADAYSPKVVQATMGSIARVNIIYTSLPAFFASLPSSAPVYGTLLEGDNIYTQPLSHDGFIVMGNEGNGISAEVRGLINRKLLIPCFPANSDTAESLNVAIATAITCSEFRRRGY